MDSFSKSTKLEIISQDAKFDVPFLFALFVSSGSYDENGNVEITTDIEELFAYVKKNTIRLCKFYEIEISQDDIIETEGFKISKKTFYKIIFKKEILQKLFNKFGLNENNSLEENVALSTKTQENIKNFSKGMFLGCGTSSIKISQKANEKTSSGYHFEFSSKSSLLLREFSHILAQFDIFAKIISRKNNFVLYLKDAEQVCNLLALVGASGAVVTLQGEMAKRDFRNKINRQTNCLSGNISKTVDASMKQLEAIKKIDEKIGIENLPPDLEEIALMRLANPEEPLTTLLKLSNMNLTKSGLNHRLRKIVAMADKL